MRRFGGQHGGREMRGDMRARLVANAEELVLHAMSAEVSIITAKMAGVSAPPKLRSSMENSLRYLDENVDALLEMLPASRALSFVEVTLFCVITHLPFRQVLDVAPWRRLDAFCRRFGERESARATEYCFDRERTA